jgi:hypothetical protein
VSGWNLTRGLLRRLSVALLFLVALALPGLAAAENEFANPGTIEGVVTKTGGAAVEGAEVCAFDVAEDEEFTECAMTKSNGAYEILGLDEGPYRVEFKSGESGLNLVTQYYRGAATPGKATIVRAEEGREKTGIDAVMAVASGTAGEPDVDGDGYGDVTADGCPQSAAFHAACPTVAFAPTYSVGPRAIEVKVSSTATTPISVTGASPGPGILTAKKRVPRSTLTSVSVPIPPALATRLRNLSPSRSLHLRLRAHAAFVDGVPSTDHLWVRLPGRGQ